MTDRGCPFWVPSHCRNVTKLHQAALQCRVLYKAAHPGLVGVSNWCIFTVHQLDVASYFLLFRESFFPIRIYHLYWYLMDFLIDRFLSVYKKLQTIEIHFVKKSFKAKISNTKKFWLEKKTPNSIWLKKSSFFCLTTHTRIILKLPYESFGLQL